MKANDLLDIIGEVNDEFIYDAKTKGEAKTIKFPNRIKWFSTIAACLFVVIGIGVFILPRMGENSAPGSNAGESG